MHDANVFPAQMLLSTCPYTCVLQTDKRAWLISITLVAMFPVPHREPHCLRAPGYNLLQSEYQAHALLMAAPPPVRVLACMRPLK